jgi:hypothetical protein
MLNLVFAFCWLWSYGVVSTSALQSLGPPALITGYVYVILSQITMLIM